MTNEPTSTDAGVVYKPPIVTFVLIGINVLIYGLIQYQGGPTYENLLKYGAKENGLIAEGEVGRLFFPMFLHASPAHILFNMFALFQFGRIFEFLAGARNVFVTYILGGLLGNAVSFALSRSLSVGASSSLFALLFALYVLERYQQRVTLDSTGVKTKSTLGPVILINALITFLIPNIDWASHLGGGVAGALIGTGLVMKHKINSRLMSMVKYWRVDPETLQIRFYQREGFYLGLICLLTFLIMMKIPSIGFTDRVFGLGVLDASQNLMEGHPESELPRYRTSFEDLNSPVHPDSVLEQSMAVMSAGHYEAAFAMLQVVKKMNLQGLGTPEFASKSTLALIEKAAEAAAAQQPFDPSLIQALTGEVTSVAPRPGFCSKAADYVRGLGFFALSGHLYECAFYLEFGSKKYALAAISDLWTESRRCEEQTQVVPQDDGVSLYQLLKNQRQSCSYDLDKFRMHLFELEAAGLLDKNGAVAQIQSLMP